MADNKEHPQSEQERHAPELESLHVGHEETDVNIWAVGKFAIALVLLCIGSLFILFGVFRYFQIQERAYQPEPAGVNIDARRLPPEPRLQTTPMTDLADMRAAEEHILNTYGWVNQQAGVVRIPINLAMDLVVQRGLPARQQAGPITAAANVSVPTEAGLGPKVQQLDGPLAPVMRASPSAEGQAK
ncbi:MAG TPA: hypothetical protein VG675_04235 [Bryobacteraceae bacterium]|nr:hypothetical protein [Bryobacteraceae bacterium]